MTVDDASVRIIGAPAIAARRTRASGSYQGRSAYVALRSTDTFRGEDGLWKIDASGGTLLASRP